MMTTATEKLASWAYGVSAKWPASVLHEAERAFLDTVACILAGNRDDATAGVLSVASAMGSGKASVMGADVALPAYWAAFVNGTAAHVLDYDDVLDPAMSHPSAPLVPAILALAEETDASGLECLDAYLVGFEVMARLGEGMNLAHYLNGWHTTLSLGVMGVAAACARLLKLNAHEMNMAIGLASSMAGGSKRQFGSMAKPMHSGLAAKNGVLAAMLARAGVTSVKDVLEGKWGMLDMTAGPAAPGFSDLDVKLGSRNAMEQFGVWLKLYPCCASTHRPIDAALALRGKGIEVENVKAVRAMLSPSAFANLRFKHPKNAMEARFSLPYCLGVAWIDGKVTTAAFRDEAIGRADVANFIDRVTLEVDPELSGAEESGRSPGDSERGTLVVMLKGTGETIREAVDVPCGHADKPLSERQLREKFFDCAAVVLPPSQSEALWAELSALSSQTSMKKITGLIRIGSQSDG